MVIPRGGISKDITKFDDNIPAVTTITENHRLIHDGFFYTFNYRNAALANGSSIEFIFNVPALTFPHIQSSHINADLGGLEVYLFEGTTTSADGTTITPVNRNRNSANTLDTVITHTPTVTGDGTEIDFHVIPANAGPPVAVTWDEARYGEFVLAPSTKYMLRINNASGAARDVQAIVSVYETDY